MMEAGHQIVLLAGFIFALKKYSHQMSQSAAEFR
jgi:hypothetical protein